MILTLNIDLDDVFFEKGFNEVEKEIMKIINSPETREVIREAIEEYGETI
jgi:hypothetical protein